MDAANQAVTMSKKTPPRTQPHMLKVANVLATEGRDTRSIPSTNDRDTTQVRELKDGASNYRGTVKVLFWIQKEQQKHRYR
jgi:hypothetical protein